MERNVYEIAVDEYMVNQSWFALHKNTIFTCAALFLQFAQWGGVYLVGAPVWVGLLVTVLIGLCEALLQAKTKGAVTESMGERLEDAAAGYFNRSLELGGSILRNIPSYPPRG